MKPDPELFKSNDYVNRNRQFVNKNNHPPTKTSLRQKLNPSSSKTLKQQIDNVTKQHWISDAAYYKSEARGFIPGHETEDWLEAEQDYVEMLVELFLSVFREDASMTIIGLRQLAKAIGIPKPEKIDSELELIRLIQAASHHRPCFRTKPGEFCHDQVGCQWNTECQTLVAEWWR
jgi:Protein of unknown function (DUF2934)